MAVEQCTMAKLLMTNLLTAALLITWFTLNPKQQLSEETLSQYQYDKTTQVDKRNPASISLDSRLKNKRKKGQLREKERKALYKKYKINQHDWRDLVVQIHSGEKNIRGKKVIISDLYQQFYENAFDTIKEYYPQDAAKRLKTYLSLKMEKEAMANKIESEYDIRREKLSDDKDKEDTAIQRNDTLSDEQKEKLHSESSSKLNELHYLREVRRNELNQNYQSNIRKVLKLAYKEISVDIEDYNFRLRSDYGKRISYSRDPKTGELLPDDRINNNYPRPAMFIIDL